VTARVRGLSSLAACAFALPLALGLPTRAAGQEPARDTTAASRPVKDLPLTAAQRQAFVGTYSATLPFGEPGGSLRIYEENGVLMGRLDDASEAKRLLYQGDNAFQPEGVPGFVFRFVLENGRATKFTVRREDGVMMGVRVP